MQAKDWFWNNLIVFPFLNTFWVIMVTLGTIFAIFGEYEWWAINTLPFYNDKFGTAA